MSPWFPPKLPLELLDRILDALDDDHSQPHTLAMCALASKDFAALAQRRLWRDVTLYCSSPSRSKDRTTQIARHLVSNPRLASYVRHVSIRLQWLNRPTRRAPPEGVRHRRAPHAPAAHGERAARVRSSRLTSYLSIISLILLFLCLFVLAELGGREFHSCPGVVRNGRPPSGRVHRERGGRGA